MAQIPTICFPFLDSWDQSDSFEELDDAFLAYWSDCYIQSQANLPINGKLVVRVYTGGDQSQQYLAWNQAWLQWTHDEVRSKRAEIDLEVLNCKTAKEKGIDTPTKLVDFLLKSHVHFILGHVHQGMETLGWSMESLYKIQMMRLYFHPGFPTGNQLVCPVFTQNKFRYLSCLGKLANPTLKVPRVTTLCFDDHNDDAHSVIIRGEEDDEKREQAILNAIKLFTEKYSEYAHDDCWVVKAPFTTNCHNRSFVQRDQILQGIIRAFRKSNPTNIPYVMVQPRMENHFERKIACFNNCVSYVTISCSQHKGSSKAFPIPEAKKFAQEALDNVKIQLDDRLVSEGLFRIDVFQRKSSTSSNAEYIVNEFESLDAAVYGKVVEECKLRSSLVGYWGKIIRSQSNYILDGIIAAAAADDNAASSNSV